MEKLLAPVITILVFVFIFLFSKLREFYRDKSLRELVAWSAIGDYSPVLGRYSYVGELLITFLNAQYNDAIDKKYRITEEADKQYVIEIIEEYQKDIMRSYFKGQSIVIKSKYAVRKEDYFMFALYTFLSDHQCDHKFIGHDMHQETLSYKGYGCWGGDLFDATFALTDFAVVFHKMYYITYIYCRKNEMLKALVPACNEKTLNEILDTKQLQVSRY